ncbi:MAG TPA: SRPBCC domain-containing protein [Gemmatales bacterium]|nr:SRPBCC domain-containing protein [Gemmatales bacterium]
MASSQFAYVTYIRTTPVKLWKALIAPEFTRQWWCNTIQECDWKPGSSWKIMIPDGRVADAGEVVEIIPEKKLVLKWRNEFMPELKAEGYTRMTCEIEQAGDSVKLSILHESDVADSNMFQSVSGGWPVLLSSLKSLLETGEGLEEKKHWPEGV